MLSLVPYFTYIDYSRIGYFTFAAPKSAPPENLVRAATDYLDNDIVRNLLDIEIHRSLLQGNSRVKYLLLHLPAGFKMTTVF